MKATKKHISLETAKLLKDCGVDSEYVFAIKKGKVNIFSRKYATEQTRLLDKKSTTNMIKSFIPAYTWQEIEDNAKVFFGEEKYISELDGSDGDYFLVRDRFDYVLDSFKIHSINLLMLRQQKKYKEADLYFRENNILINNYEKANRNKKRN